MPGRGPAPMKGKHGARRGPVTPGFKQLPHEGRSGDPPAWPLPAPDSSERAEREATEWARVWGLPQAIEWERMRCETWVALYVRVYVRASETGANEKLLAEVRQIDAKIGLSPRAMNDLRWETDEALTDDDNEQAATGNGHRPFVPGGESS